ncbi:cupin domain-containing protein [Nocardia sp. NPDC051030]|uniref:cupin domain-containing protein n=1 Tax=Nocardia sp. NPDC051030 TaxID=3155162 RepID=UPI0034493C51
MIEEQTRTAAQPLRYTRIDSTPAGGSRFIEAEIPLAERVLAAGVPAMAVGGLSSAAGVSFLRSGGFDSEPHPAPARQWVVLLRGVLEVTASDGDRRRFSPGDLLFVTDTEGRGHTTVAVGEGPFEALFIPEGA